MKCCSKCKVEKGLNEFSKNKSTKDGLQYICKSCDSIKCKKYNEKNKDKFKEYNKEYYENNKNKIREHNKEYYENNKDKFKEHNKEYYENNKDYYKEYYENNKDYYKEYYENNKDYYKEYKINNKDKINKRSKERLKERLKYDPIFKLICAYRKKERNFRLNGKGSFGEILGLSHEQYTKWIEENSRQFLGPASDIYKWSDENYTKTHYQIDHIKPLSSAKTIDELKLLLHHTNIQIISAYENMWVKRSNF